MIPEPPSLPSTMTTCEGCRCLISSPNCSIRRISRSAGTAATGRQDSAGCTSCPTWGCSAYFAIPCILGYFLLRRRDIPFRTIFWLFVAFILACGTTHLMEAFIFWWPAYRLAGVIKLLTALISWGTVVALVPIIPKVLVLRPRRIGSGDRRSQTNRECLTGGEHGVSSYRPNRPQASLLAVTQILFQGVEEGRRRRVHPVAGSGRIGRLVVAGGAWWWTNGVAGKPTKRAGRAGRPRAG